MSENKKAAKAEFSAWMKSNMERLHLSQNQLAKRARISVNTISRYCNEDDGAEPKMSYVKIISEAFGAKPPSFYGFEEPAVSYGLSEPGVEMLPSESGPEWNGNLSNWRVKDNAMQVMGYLAGDIVMADARVQPVDGDVVIANLYSPGGTSARTVLRVYKKPGYLIPAAADARSLEVHEIGKNAAIFGVVVESIRRRTLS